MYSVRALKRVYLFATLRQMQRRLLQRVNVFIAREIHVACKAIRVYRVPRFDRFRLTHFQVRYLCTFCNTTRVWLANYRAATFTVGRFEQSGTSMRSSALSAVYTFEKRLLHVIFTGLWDNSTINKCNGRYTFQNCKNGTGGRFE